MRLTASHRLAAGIVVLGALLRIAGFAEQRPLWLDEAMVALNVGRRSYLGLLEPLGYDQVAPAFYLWVVKTATVLLGMNELALRLPALVAGLALPWIVWLLGRRLIGDVGGLIAALLVACSPVLVGYANEVKPYGLDAFATASLLLLAHRAMFIPNARNRVLLGAGGVLAVGFSLPSVFTLAAISLVLFGDAFAHRDRRLGVAALGWATLWLVVFTAQFLHVVGGAAADSTMRGYWDGAMIDVGTPGWTARVRMALGETLQPFAALPYRLRTWLPLPLFAVSALILLRRGTWRTAALLVLPVAAALAASAVGVYPVIARLALFLAPIGALALAVPLSTAWDASAHRRLPRLVVGMVIALLGVTSIRTASRPLARDEGGRTLIAELRQQRDDEPVYLLPSAVPLWVFETTDWAFPDTARLDRYARVATSGGSAFHNAESRGRPVQRVGGAAPWAEADGLVIVGQSTGMRYVYVRDYLTAVPDTGWGDAEVARLRATGPSAWLFGAHAIPQESDALREAIARAGGRIVFEGTEPRAFLWRVLFDESLITP